jgi:3D (Asp-Asp-Asp) domain-containing protein
VLFFSHKGECNNKNKQVVATAYALGDGHTPNKVTATGRRPRHLRTVAVSRSMEKRYPMGTKIKIEGYGERVFIIEDRMSRKFHFDKIDIFYSNKRQAIKFGKKKLRVRKVNK